MNIKAIAALVLTLLQTALSGGVHKETDVRILSASPDPAVPAEKIAFLLSSPRTVEERSLNLSARNIVFRATIVTVTINRVRRIDLMDPPPDPGADFYALVSIGGTESASSVSGNRDHITPQWTFAREVSTTTVPIVIKLFDKDVPGADDHCDINPRSRERDIHISYNLSTGRFTGDVAGLRQRLINVHGYGDGKRAAIWFTIDHR